MIDTEWLKALKEGDEIAISHTVFGGGVWYEFVHVTRRTPTSVAIGSRRYRVSDGCGIGSSYGLLVRATPELRQQDAIRKQRQLLISKIETVQWEHLSLAALQAVNAALMTKQE